MKRRVFCIVLLLILLLVITSCKKEYKRIPCLNAEEILSLDGTYYVFIYMNSCDICKSIEEDVYDYYKEAKRHSDMPNLYVVNRSEKDNYDVLTKSCHDEGDDDYSSLVGSTNYQDIKLCTSPVMLKVRNNTIKKVLDTKSSILEELSK